MKRSIRENVGGNFETISHDAAHSWWCICIGLRTVSAPYVPENESLSILGTIAHLVIDCPRSWGSRMLWPGCRFRLEQTCRRPNCMGGGEKKEGRRKKYFIQTYKTYWIANEAVFNRANVRYCFLFYNSFVIKKKI